MASGPQPSSARVHSVRSTCRGLATAPNRPGWRGPHGTGRPAHRGGPRRQHAHTRRLWRMLHAWSIGCGATTGGRRLLGRRDGLAGDNHWTTATPHDKVSRPSSSRIVMASRGRCSLVAMLYPRQNRGVHMPAAVGGVTKVAGSSGTCTRGRKVGEATRHRPRGRKQRRSSLPESRRGSGGAWPNGFEGVPFIGVSTGTDGTARGGS
jgi:hypothetical protein